MPLQCVLLHHNLHVVGVEKSKNSFYSHTNCFPPPTHYLLLTDKLPPTHTVISSTYGVPFFFWRICMLPDIMNAAREIQLYIGRAMI